MAKLFVLAGTLSHDSGMETFWPLQLPLGLLPTYFSGM